MSAEIQNPLEALVEMIVDRTMAKMDPRPRLLSVRQAAEYIGRSEDAIRRLEAKKVIPGVRGDGRLQFDRKDLDAWIDISKVR